MIVFYLFIYLELNRISFKWPLLRGNKILRNVILKNVAITMFGFIENLLKFLGI